MQERNACSRALGAQLLLAVMYLSAACGSEAPTDEADASNEESTDGVDPADGAGPTDGPSSMDAEVSIDAASSMDASTPYDGPPPSQGDGEPNPSARARCNVSLDESGVCRLALHETVRTDRTPWEVVDSFVFDAEKGETYSLRAAFSRGMIEGSIDAWHHEGETVVNDLTWRGQVGGVANLEVTAPKSGPQRVDVGMIGGASYELTIFPSTAAGLSHGAASHEYNDTRSTATPLPIGVAHAGALIPHSDDVSYWLEDDVDWYVFSVKEGITYTLHLDQQNCSPLMVDIDQTRDGQPVMPYRLHAANFEFAASFTGDLRARFQSYDARCTYGFGLFAGNGAHDRNTYEFNDSPSTAAPLATRNLTAKISGPDDYYDHYLFNVVAGTKYTVRMSTTCPQLDAVARWPGDVSGAPTFTSSLKPGTDATHTFTPTSSGPQLLTLSSLSAGRQACSYTFKIDP